MTSRTTWVSFDIVIRPVAADATPPNVGTNTHANVDDPVGIEAVYERVGLGV
jgi:hypothetical protein